MLPDVSEGRDVRVVAEGLSLWAEKSSWASVVSKSSLRDHSLPALETAHVFPERLLSVPRGWQS